jgi:hypothetical protein
MPNVVWKSAVADGVGCAWSGFEGLAPFLTAGRVSLQVRGGVYGGCVGSCMRGL